MSFTVRTLARSPVRKKPVSGKGNGVVFGGIEIAGQGVRAAAAQFAGGAVGQFGSPCRGRRCGTRPARTSGVPTVVSLASPGESSRVTAKKPSAIPNSWPAQMPRFSICANRSGGTFAPDSTTRRTDPDRARDAVGDGPVVGVPDEYVRDLLLDQQWQRCCGVGGSEDQAGAALCGAWTPQTIPALWMIGMRWATRLCSSHPSRSA